MDREEVQLGAVVIAILAVLLIAALFLGGSVSQRLGGPCTDDQRPLPSFCTVP
jgi:hypothetical protein